MGICPGKCPFFGKRVNYFCRKRIMDKNLSYYELALSQYLMQHHPNRMDEEFIAARSEMANREFCRCSKAGMSVDDAIMYANRTLYKGLLFSPFDMTVEILENEFKDIPEEEHRELAIQMLERCGNIIGKYHTDDDDFQGSPDYMLLYNEMTGNISFYLENYGIQS